MRLTGVSVYPRIAPINDRVGGWSVFGDDQRRDVEVKIGIQSVPRELVVETETSQADVEAALTAALADESVFVLAEAKGSKIFVPAKKIAYVEFTGSEQRRVGFSNV
jgi:hypothetical protein